MEESPSLIASDLIGLIYDAVADASGWHVFLEAFVHATGSKGGTLILTGPAMAGWRAACWYPWTDEEIRLYVEKYAPIDPWRNGMNLPEGQVRTSDEIYPADEFEKSLAYRE